MSNPVLDVGVFQSGNKFSAITDFDRLLNFPSPEYTRPIQKTFLTLVTNWIRERFDLIRFWLYFADQNAKREIPFGTRKDCCKKMHD